MGRFRIIFLFFLSFESSLKNFNLCAIVNLQVIVGVHQWQGWCLGCVLWGLGVCEVWLGQATCVALCRGLWRTKIQLLHKLLVYSNLCDCKQNFNHKKFMCICCAYPFVSLVLTTSNIRSKKKYEHEFISISTHICEKIWCISLCLFFRKNMLYWYSTICLKTWYSNNIN
jgi:hypothetical protein